LDTARKDACLKHPFFYFFRQSLTRETLVPAASESLSLGINRES
jgi:hypothetical protein